MDEGPEPKRNPRVVLKEIRRQNRLQLQVTRQHRMPIHENTTGFTFELYLRQFNLNQGLETAISQTRTQDLKLPHKTPYVHERCVSFSTSIQRLRYLQRCGPQWESDIASRDTFDEFWCEPKGDRSAWMCMTAIPTNGWDAGYNVDDEVWHAAALLILKNPAEKRKLFIIWDCDPTEGVNKESRARTAVTGYQRSFLSTVLRRARNTSIWYNVDRSLSGQGKCVLHSMEKIRSWFSVGDQPYIGPDDPRLAGCIELEAR